ncbi:DNA-binding protein [Actinocorallia sp. A-T 12471]|uniref:DNA-binding protein n=1 Tax=Actinocorallia sp. A-T 12471 TaxID=3089813 RepID=UPI0029CB0EAA|nr:DNA-binding protein [Actinocorallia sp. A-T 12471]MDX6742781.1 DNA-binding protein [Actinocorallia sp. A-T 12471]
MSADKNTSTAEQLLAAGAVLPPGVEAEGAVPIAARSYVHPALDDRVVVRLAPADLGAAEDLAAGFLGLVLDGEPAIVGAGPRQTLGFPEWVLANHPEDGHAALAVVPELDRLSKQAKNKPKAAMDGLVALGQRLASSVPHLLPTYFERAGRAFLAVENAQYAGQLFSRARRAEVEHGLEIDEDRLDEVFLEYALAGALPVKTLSGYAKELSARVEPAEALSRYTRLCVRRASGGMPPSAQMGNDLRRLAREAGGDALETELAYVVEMLELPATGRAGAGWWKAHRAALVELARREPDARRRLLDLMPAADDGTLSRLWLDILVESGAAEGLYADAPDAPRPSDGSAGWLRRFLAFRRQGYRQPSRYLELEELVTRMADRLRAELAADGTALPIPASLDLLDLMLELGLPVTDPGHHHTLAIESWAASEDRRDLRALGADERFHLPVKDSADGVGPGEAATLKALAAAPGTRDLTAEWVRDVAARSTATGLPGLPSALHRLSWLPGEIMTLAEDAVRAATKADLGDILARTLRAGLFDELSWPAFEDAVNELGTRDSARHLTIAEEWPYLVIANKAKAIVVGLEGRVLEHDLRTPPEATETGFHYVDGDLLVFWESSGTDAVRGYWLSDPGRVLRVEGASVNELTLNWHRGYEPVTFPLPGGGRVTAKGVFRAGDSVLPGAAAEIVTDGRNYWIGTYRNGPRQWVEYDPQSGETGRDSVPAFLAEHAGGPDDGEPARDGWLLPFPGRGHTPVGPVVDGLIGVRLIRKGGEVRAEDLSGNTSLYCGSSYRPGVLYFPGDDKPRTFVRQSWRVDLHDAEGVHTAHVITDGPAGDYALGTVILPPLRYWAHLSARDERGSAALRRIDAATASALIEAVAKGGDAAEAVRTFLPDVTHEGLITGICGVTQKASEQRVVLDQTVRRLEQTLSGEAEDEFEGPTDRPIQEALSGLIDTGRYWNDEQHGVTAILHRYAFLANGKEPAVDAGGLHLDQKALPPSRIEVATLVGARRAATYRALLWATDDAARGTLRFLSEALDNAGLTFDAADRWRQVAFRLPKPYTRLPNGAVRSGHRRGVLPLEGGAFLAFEDWDSQDSGDVFNGLFHDPQGRFAPPAPYEAVSSAELKGWWNGQAPPAAYFTELDARGPAPWFAGAAEEFARLTGTTSTVAALVVAGLPGLDDYERSFLPADVRKTLGVKVAEAAVARNELRQLKREARGALIGALLPADPAALWTSGPDVVAAAEVWNRLVGRKVALPEALLAEAVKAVRYGWDAAKAMRAVLDPAASPHLTRDLEWKIDGDKVAQADSGAEGFTSAVLNGTVVMAAWLAHRLPAGDPLRASLPAALEAVHARLAHPGLMLSFSNYFDVTGFRKAAGAPTEEGEGFVRYGAIVLPTHDSMPYPSIRVALLDEEGGDPFLPALRSAAGNPFPVELALRLARSDAFAALLADPGDPVEGERLKDGTWYPQDPSRSVPDLVAEVSEAYGLSADAATVYLMLLAMPDPTDRDTARWTGWKPARIKAARAELAATDHVVEARRARAGRTLFLPGPWVDARAKPSLEGWKQDLYEMAAGGGAPLNVVVPTEPVADLYRRAWRRVADGDGPRFADLKVRKGGRRR